MKSTRNRNIKLLGLAGIAGGIIMLIGDWLFYFAFVSGQEFRPGEIMRTMSDNRLSIGGALGPFASLLYCLGAISLYFGLRDTNEKIALWISALLVVLFVNTGAYHALYPVYGFIAKISDAGKVLVLKTQLNGLMGMLYNIQFIAGLLATLLFFYLVLVKKTIFPKWLVIFFPTIPVLFSGIAKLVPSPVGGIVAGSWDNAWFVVFFCISTYYLKTTIIAANDKSVQPV